MNRYDVIAYVSMIAFILCWAIFIYCIKENIFLEFIDLFVTLSVFPFMGMLFGGIFSGFYSSDKLNNKGFEDEIDKKE